MKDNGRAGSGSRAGSATPFSASASSCSFSSSTPWQYASRTEAGTAGTLPPAALFGAGARDLLACCELWGNGAGAGADRRRAVGWGGSGGVLLGRAVAGGVGRSRDQAGASASTRFLPWRLAASRASSVLLIRSSSRSPGRISATPQLTIMWPAPIDRAAGNTLADLFRQAGRLRQVRFGSQEHELLAAPAAQLSLLVLIC